MTTIRVDQETRARLRAIASRTHATVEETVAEAILRYDEDLFWADYQAGYARLRANPRLWSAWIEELRLLDGVAADGLD